MAEASNRLEKTVLVIAAAAVPAGGALYFKEHPVLAAFAGEMLVVAAAFVTKVWDKIETQYVDAVAKAVPPKLKAFVTRYRARYRRAMYFLHRSFDVKGLNTQGAISLELDQVFVELSLSPEAPHKISTDPLRKPIEPGERRDIWDFLKNPQCRLLAILGPPGSGKTTLLKHVVLALAGPRKRRPLPLTPVLLYLRDIANEVPKITLADAIRKSLPARFQPPAGWLEGELERQRCVILLDGLDEVAEPEARARVAKWIEQQTTEHGETRFVVTSRPNGYLANPLNGVTVLDVKPFTWLQVERFVHNWYLATETVRAGKRDTGVELAAESGARDLLQRLGSASALTDLAVNPLLLTMITTVHKERNSLPGRRVELYNEICDVFLGKRQASKGLTIDLTPAQKRRVLGPLAWRMMLHNLRVVTVEDARSAIAPVLANVGPKVEPDRFLESVRDDSGLMIEKESGEYAFAHLTFQEYLAATHAREQRLETELVARVAEPWWAETIRLYCAQTDATRIVEACVAGPEPPVEALVLGSECLEEGLEVGSGARERVEAVVVEGIEAKDSRLRRVAAEVQLRRFLNSMVRVSEDTYRSRDLVPNVVYELFLSECSEVEPPANWDQRRFCPGDGKSAALGVVSTAAIQFCAWLTDRRGDGDWHYTVPGGSAAGSGQIGFWVRRDDGGLRCERLPEGWVAHARQALEVRLARVSYPEARALAHVRARALARELESPLERALESDLALGFARDLESALDVARALESDHDLARALESDLGLALALARDIESALDRDLNRALDRARDRARDLALALARDLALPLPNMALRDTEALSLLLLGLVRPGTPSARQVGDFFIWAALTLEQREGRIPPMPVGIALVRTRAQKEPPAHRKAASASE